MNTWFTLAMVLALALAPLSRPPRAAPQAHGPVAIGERIDAFVREQAQRHGIPGLAVAVVDGEQIVHSAGYGAADSTGRAVTPQTPFVLASASKPLTALAVMQLVEAGSIALDAPVQRYLPTFQVADPAASRQITVRHLLQHTSGLPERACRSRSGAKTLDQFVAELRTIELLAPVGTRYAYCSGNYNLLGRVVEVVSGQSFAAYMQQHVFTPLQMRHSFATEPEARQAGLAQNVAWVFGLPMPAAFPYDIPQVPSGFLISSAEDMAHFMIAQLNGGQFGGASILSPQGIAAMHAPGVPMGADGATYGLGWRNETLGGLPVVLHTGDHPNAHTLVVLEPELRRGAVLLFNSFSMLARTTAFAEIEAGLAQLLAEQQPAPLTSPSLPTLYAIADALLGGLLVLVLVPLMRMRRWATRLRQEHQAGQVRRLRLVLRLVWEFGLPLALLAAARWFLHMLGAQSWSEGLLLFPDLGAWIWVLSLLMLLTGTIRLLLLRRVLRQGGTKPASAPLTRIGRRPA